MDREGSQVTSRLGVAAPAIDVTPDLDLYALAVRHWPLHYLVCDEAQFYTVEQCDQLARVVDDLEIDVLRVRAAHRFPGPALRRHAAACWRSPTSTSPLQVEARCWCGARATHNARVVNGVVVYEGETVVVGDTNEQNQPLFGDTVRYELVCRSHFRAGNLGG